MVCCGDRIYNRLASIVDDPIMLFTKLSSFYFFYFSLLGVMAPYLGLYLEYQGFELFEIAQLSSILMLTKVLAPNIWGHVADRYQNRLLLVRVGSIATLFCYVGFFFADLFWHYAFVVGLFSFFWNAVLPQYEVLTLHNLPNASEWYSRIRLWGSVGFIASVVGGGFIFDAYSVDLFPYVVLGVVFFIALASFYTLDEPSACEREERHESTFIRQLCQRPVYLFFAICFLLQLSHGAYYTYFSIFLETLGYDKTEIGLLWGLGVFAEVILFCVMHYWLERWAVKGIMFFALVLTALRWLTISFFAESLPALVFAQCLHAMSFGAMHAASIHFVHLSFDHRNQGRAQALYSSLGFGLGGAVGAILSGITVRSFGYEAAFLISACCAFIAAMLVLVPKGFVSKLSVD